MTTDVAAAAAFYTEVIGWGAQDASVPGTPYTLLAVGEATVAGVMSLPEGARRAGATPRWVGYVSVNDIDATAEGIAQRGGMVHVPPTEIPDVSRIAIVADPQTAMFGLITWLDADDERPGKTDAAGRGGWHELLAADAKSAFPFYAELFGWQKAETDFDQLGTYQVFAIDKQAIGGIFTKPPMVPVPFWLFYFNGDDIDAAAARTKAAGGEVLEGPVDVKGGAWVIRCVDPQGAMFALRGPRGKKISGYFERTASRDPSNAQDRRWSW